MDFTFRHFLTPITDGMQAQGWQVIAVCSDGTFVPQLRAQGYRLIALPIDRSLNPLRHAVSLFRLVALFRRERFDVLHVHTPIAALLGRVAGRVAGIPMIIYTAHGFYFHENTRPLAKAAHMFLEWIGGQLTDLLFTVSAEDAATAVRCGFVRPAQVVAIGNGVDPGRFKPGDTDVRERIRASLGVPCDAIAIGMIGRMVTEKGYREFFAAARRIAEVRPNVYFVGVGDRLPSDHAGTVEAEVRQAREALGDRLVLTGLRDDVPDILAGLDVFTLPSYREGMPITIIEAMMMALPVVATDIRGSREEVVAGETGLIVKVRDEKALAEALLTLIDDGPRRKRMGCAGRARALALYDEAIVVQQQIAEIRARLPMKLRVRA